MSTVPRSFVFFLATAVVFVLQLLPILGIFLMVLAAMFWSVLLINAGMLGTAWEALTGRVSRWWLVLPAAFYGGYFGFAAGDNAALRQLGESYDAANAKITVPFDPERQSLVFDGDGNESGNDGSRLVRNYDLPVAYSRNPNYPESLRSNRLIEGTVCDEVRKNKALRAAGVNALPIYDGSDGGFFIDKRTMETRFCDLGMSERPVLPLVAVARHKDKFRYASLPITRVTTTITTPDGRRFQLLGGSAAPLGWMPMPVMGCGLNSGGAKWECVAEFMRNDHTPIVARKTPHGGDALARALGLKHVEIADRKGGDAMLVRMKLAEVEGAALARQLAAVDRMIANPIAKVEDWQTDVIIAHPEVLGAKADAIMAGLERAAAFGGPDWGKASESGRILAQLIAALPRDRFVAYGPRLLALYRSGSESESDGSRWLRSHWLWGSGPLLRRLGDLGPGALFVVVDPRAAGEDAIEAMCRIGAAGREKSGPVLLDMWQKVEWQDRKEQRALFVAMRRVGIAPPPLTDNKGGHARSGRWNPADAMDKLTEEWSDVTPASLPRVCSPREEQARREERYSGKRRTNLI